MLLAVEGGGFFSSSASGYSKGLALLLLGQRTDEKHMRLASWNRYQLVDQETDSDLQLASGKNQNSRGCASFVCFSRTSARLDGQSPLKVGPNQPQDILPGGPATEKDKELSTIVNDDNNARNISLKSSLKKPSHNTPQTISNHNEQESMAEECSDPSELLEKKKVQWTDACGKELAEVREFELREESCNKPNSTRCSLCTPVTSFKVLASALKGVPLWKRFAWGEASRQALHLAPELVAVGNVYSWIRMY